MKRGLHLAAACAMLVLAHLPAPSFGAEIDENYFSPRGGVVVQGSGTDADLEALQLAGISFIGEERLFNFVDSRTRRSFWVALNGTNNGMTVNSFDAASDSVVVQRGALSKTIKLRRSVILALAPAATVPSQPAAPGAVPPAQAQTVSASGYVTSGSTEIVNPKTPQQIAQAETEARMLVSDLLEISMQERARQRALREGRPAPQPNTQVQPLQIPATPQR